MEAKSKAKRALQPALTAGEAVSGSVAEAVNWRVALRKLKQTCRTAISCDFHGQADGYCNFQKYKAPLREATALVVAAVGPDVDPTGYGYHGELFQ